MILNQIDNARLGTDQVDKIYLGQDLVWTNGNGPDYASMYLTIEALETGTLNVTKTITYSINEGTWVTSTGETALSLNSGDKVRFKGDSNTDATSLFSGNTLASNVYGNVMSLKYGDNFSGQTTIFIHQEMFKGYTGLVDAGNLVLPATTLASNCYSAMFIDCTSLVTAPVLPATTLATNCYAQMFQGCTSLVDAPELPVNTLTQACYYRMFRGCTSLNYIKCLATKISASNCTSGWVKDVSSTGTFIKNSAMSSWTTGNNGIPSGWTVVNAS